MGLPLDCLSRLWAYYQGQWYQMRIPGGKHGDHVYWRELLRSKGFATCVVRRDPSFFHIDARGVSNPAETEAAVWRGIKAAAPHLISASVQAVSNQRARKPSGSC